METARSVDLCGFFQITWPLGQKFNNFINGWNATGDANFIVYNQGRADVNPVVNQFTGVLKLVDFGLNAELFQGLADICKSAIATGRTIWLAQDIDPHYFLL